MNGNVLTTLITGGFAKVPGQQVQQCLRQGCELKLVPEPDNPYDEFAIKVFVDPGEISQLQYQELKDRLEGTGWDLIDVLQGDDVQLGYVAATNGKPLARAGLSIGNQQFHKAAQQLGLEAPWPAILSFSPEGHPMVSLQLQRPSASREGTS